MNLLQPVTFRAATGGIQTADILNAASFETGCEGDNDGSNGHPDGGSA